MAASGPAAEPRDPGRSQRRRHRRYPGHGPRSRGGTTYNAVGNIYVLYGKNTASTGDFASSISLTDITATTGASFTDNVFSKPGPATRVELRRRRQRRWRRRSDRRQPGSYAAYVVFGEHGNLELDFDLTTLDGTNGFKIIAPGDPGPRPLCRPRPATSMRDGYDDILVQDWHSGVHGADTGEAWVVSRPWRGLRRYPRTYRPWTGPTASRSTGKRRGTSCIRSAGIGDVNNDGVDDIAVSSYYNTANRRPGRLRLGHLKRPRQGAFRPDRGPAMAAESLTAIAENYAPPHRADQHGQHHLQRPVHRHHRHLRGHRGHRQRLGRPEPASGSTGTARPGRTSAPPAWLRRRFSPPARRSGSSRPATSTACRRALTVKLIDSSAGALTNGSHIDTSGGLATGSGSAPARWCSAKQ